MENPASPPNREDFQLTRPTPQKPRSSPLSIALAAVVAMAGFSALVFLMLPLAYVTVTVAGVLLVLAAVAAFHYFVWGWWLSGMIHAEVEAEERDAADGRN